MGFMIKAACSCHAGNLRKNNEDNFCFHGSYLEAENCGSEDILILEETAKPGMCFAVFDGMGGECFGEEASFSAAQKTAGEKRSLLEQLLPAEQYLRKLILRINHVVVEKSVELCTERMGSTVAMLYFTHQDVLACNVGDSRIYCLRDGSLLQLSVDHIEEKTNRNRRKPPLTQHLGIDPVFMQIEPHIIRRTLKTGDQYLLCSDGLTDMVDDEAIKEIMQQSADVVGCVQKLVEAALEAGGRDNITAILCRVE